MKNLIKHFNALKEWKHERHLTLEGQREGYIRNIMEELGELAEAIKNNDSDGKIDALCDILVFSLNILDDIDKDEALMPLPNETSTEKCEASIMQGVGNILWNNFNTLDVKLLYVVLKDLATLYGYDLDVAMDETIKEISSRTGFYDESLKKFVKFTDDKAKAKWYKADYNKAKL